MMDENDSPVIENRLLEGAQRAVVQYGAAGATLERIAGEAGMSA